ncbi:MAG: tryptophan synthase subunit alpha [Spirochaetaceae bacterium]|jgi:tryptophan synthase alpha chain|nr:tryptophan synthase subunit alpha [Spirochaetaceae bacterium]
MNRIQSAFGNGKAFIAFLTGGDPSIAVSKELIGTMEKAGADLIEIGIPFSDPIAEGPVISEANIRALKAGATVEKLFTLVKDVRQTVRVPFVFLTYLNPVFRYGYDAFFARCGECGIDGIIIPDLPYEESAEVKVHAAKHGVDLISLIAPTSEDRIKEIAQNAEGFIYLVSSMGVTGVRGEIKTDLSAMVSAVREAARTPTAVGFGVHAPDQAREIAKIADGVIVGSAIVKIIAEYGENACRPVYEYVKAMKEAVSGT